MTSIAESQYQATRVDALTLLNGEKRVVIMKEIMLLSGLFTALAALLALVMASVGVFAMITGRCTLCRDRVQGRAARIAGFFLTIPLVLGIGTLPAFEPTLGIYDQRARILMPLLAAISVLLGIVLAFRQRAKATAESG